jgi:hypothetical protein
MNDVASPAIPDNTIGSLRSGTHSQEARRLDLDAILFAPSRRTRLCCPHEYTRADRRDADAAALKSCTITAAVSGRLREWKNPSR